MTLWGALTCLRAEKTPFEPDLDHTSVGKYAMVVGHQPSAVSRTCGGFKHFYYYKRVTENRSHKTESRFLFGTAKAYKAFGRRAYSLHRKRKTAFSR